MSTLAKTARILGIAAIGAAASLAMPAMALADDQTATYVSAPGDAATFSLNAVPGTGFGGYGFKVSPGDVLTIKIQDKVNPSVNGTAQFTDNSLNGKQVGDTVDICGGSKSGIVVPDKAAYVFIFVPTVGAQLGLHIGVGVPPTVSGPGPHLACGSPNGATTGTITVSGSSAGASPAAAGQRSTVATYGTAAAMTSVHSSPSRTYGPRGLRAL